MLDHVVAADHLIAVEAVASIVELELPRLAPQACFHFADDLAVFEELEIPRKHPANSYEQAAPVWRRTTCLRLLSLSFGFNLVLSFGLPSPLGSASVLPFDLSPEN